MKLTTVRGVSLAFEQFGDAASPPIILVRGLGTQLIDWPRNFIDGLTGAGFRVVVFDNRDAGLSEKFSGMPDIKAIARGESSPPYTLDDMADDILGLMDGLDIRRAHLFAISMGGMIGQVLAANHGERLITFCPVMTSSGRRGLPGPSPAAAASLQAEADPTAGVEGIIAATAHGLLVCGSPGYPGSEEKRLNIARRRYERNYAPSGVLRQMAAVVASGSRVALLKRIRTPTLVIHGADDPLVPLAAGEDIARCIPGATLYVVPGMGHDLPEPLMPTLVERVADFCRGQRA